MAKFRVGQRCEILDSPAVKAYEKRYVGLTCTVVQVTIGIFDDYIWYIVDHDGLYVREDHLRPIDDHGSWDEITRLVGFDIRTGRPQHA